METTPRDESVCSSCGCEIPSWFASNHKRNAEKTASRKSMIPSPLPPFAGRSYTASAAKPFGLLEGGCEVKLPKSCLPLSMRPSAPGNSREAFAAPWTSPPIWIGVPVPEMSKRTPPAALVSWNPEPSTSMITGEGLQPWSWSAAGPPAGQSGGGSPPPPPPVGVGQAGLGTATSTLGSEQATAQPLSAVPQE